MNATATPDATLIAREQNKGTEDLSLQKALEPLISLAKLCKSLALLIWNIVARIVSFISSKLGFAPIINEGNAETIEESIVKQSGRIDDRTDEIDVSDTIESVNEISLMLKNSVSESCGEHALVYLQIALDALNEICASEENHCKILWNEIYPSLLPIASSLNVKAIDLANALTHAPTAELLTRRYASLSELKSSVAQWKERVEKLKSAKEIFAAHIAEVQNFEFPEEKEKAAAFEIIKNAALKNGDDVIIRSVIDLREKKLEKFENESPAEKSMMTRLSKFKTDKQDILPQGVPQADLCFSQETPIIQSAIDDVKKINKFHRFVNLDEIGQDVNHGPEIGDTISLRMG